MNRFVYDIPTKVYFGENHLKKLGSEVSQYGKKVLLTYGGGSIKKSGLYDKVIAELEKAGLEIFELAGIDPNPRVTSVTEGAEICKREGIDVLLAVGGGSVIDCTKFIGAAAFYDGDAWDISIGKAPVEKCLPIISVLTLSATGSEMDAMGVISNLETKEKVGMGSPLMQPKVSFLDPTTTYTVSKFQTACGAADMLNHIMEIYFNRENDLFMLDRVMEGLMKTIIQYGPIAMAEPNNYEARANLMWTSSWAINGFLKGSKRQAWTCHPIEHELSAYYDITHGLGLAIIAPRWLTYTLDEDNVSKFYDFGVNVFDIDKSLEPMVVAKQSIEKLEDFLFNTLELQSTLTEIGIDETHFEIMAKKACQDGVLEGFKPLRAEDIVNIFKMCL
ncbi:iron-containing alcohol dehydrogenase [Fusibacter ferrireducens]|uniref:Iron-containing alcohol dehydrogenase n=1 Tax=Fusibacter ferrireducens TaxID=2785058 RepID=A0ABR9ZQ79_9FIRM|nr:iron-containing alcohol dehydrogenase [Fusibacter ferrireducens]MBF4692608.1 iron-containing alcohol dehydrogenase [Fusibacter ferrireducens]